MKTVEQVKPNYAPIYAAALYPELAKIFVKHGYALAVHGSLARDMDLIAVPWAEKVSEPEAVIQEITSHFDIRVVDVPGRIDRVELKNHGRIAYTVSIGHGECAIDLSFMPSL